MRTQIHKCGGTIITGTNPKHQCCSKCGAFAYNMRRKLPSGTDRAANQAAYDAGEEQSPEEEKNA
jgi:hypothetical protein